MYKVLPVDGAWDVFWVESPEHEPVRMPHMRDGRAVPYKNRQSAYRRAKKLNDMLKPVEKQISESGAITAAVR